MQSIGGTILLSDLYDLDQIKWLSNELTKICKDSLIIDQSIDISQLTKCESELYLTELTLTIGHRSIKKIESHVLNFVNGSIKFYLHMVGKTLVKF